MRSGGPMLLANLSITAHLRCLSDQPVAEIVQQRAYHFLRVHSGQIGNQKSPGHG